MNKKYEFGGPAGNIIIMLGLPAAVYYLYFCVRFNHGRIIPGADMNFLPFNSFLDSIVPTRQAALIFILWFFFQGFFRRFCRAGRSMA